MITVIKICLLEQRVLYRLLLQVFSLCVLVYCCTVSFFSFFILDSEAVSVLSMGEKETRFHINLTKNESFLVFPLLT